MNSTIFRKAQSIEKRIKDINHIISGLEKQSFYKLALINCGDDKTKEVSEHLGRDYMEQAHRDLINALTLKRVSLQEEFARYVSP